jgi:hypothetical protein
LMAQVCGHQTTRYFPVINIINTAGVIPAWSRS